MSRCKILAQIILLIFLSSGLRAYDEKFAHPDLTESAIGKSNLDNYLKSSIALPDGVRTIYDGKTIIKLIADGSSNEDLGMRARNHFWNPLKDEGLNDLITGLPNRSWAFGYGENGEQLYACGSGSHWMDGSCNDYSWRKAREHYYAALTGITEEVRKENFKKMYESLGRIIHLIEDMGVPAHTRNDFSGHLDYTELKGKDPMSWVGNLYEFHVKKKARENAAYISSLSQSATIPVFDTPQEYWGTGIYNGTNPEVTAAVTGPAQAGLAEYCSANFLSRFTLFTNSFPREHKHHHPFPSESSLASLEAVPHEVTAEDGKVDLITHPAKDKHGEQMNDFVAAKYVADRIHAGSLNDMTVYYRLAYYLDDVVHETYAARLIPKTVGYAAGLINCFFRGTLSIEDNTIETFDDRYRIALSVRNTTATGEDMSSGNFQLVIRHPAGGNVPGYLVVPETGNVHQIQGGGLASLSFEVSRQGLPESQLKGLLDLFVVYRGNLAGSTVHETDAVCVGHQQIEYFPMMNPELVDINCPSFSTYETGHVCAANLLRGCDYRLEIENIDYHGPGTFSISLAHCFLDNHDENVGHVIEDLRDFELRNTCTTAPSCASTGGIAAALEARIDKDPSVSFGPGDYYQFEIVLTNLTTGTVARGQCRQEFPY